VQSRVSERLVIGPRRVRLREVLGQDSLRALRAAGIDQNFLTRPVLLPDRLEGTTSRPLEAVSFARETVERLERDMPSAREFTDQGQQQNA
jgi:hypothetical protein